MNNVYLFQGDRAVLVDTGSGSPAVRDRLDRGLDDGGSSVAGVDVVVLTHYHIDHCEQVAEIQRRSGATVYAHDDLALVTGDEEIWVAVIDRRQQMYDQWGILTDKQDDLEKNDRKGEYLRRRLRDARQRRCDDIRRRDRDVSGAHAGAYGRTCVAQASWR